MEFDSVAEYLIAFSCTADQESSYRRVIQPRRWQRPGWQRRENGRVQSSGAMERWMPKHVLMAWRGVSHKGPHRVNGYHDGVHGTCGVTTVVITASIATVPRAMAYVDCAWRQGNVWCGRGRAAYAVAMVCAQQEGVPHERRFLWRKTTARRIPNILHFLWKLAVSGLTRSRESWLWPRGEWSPPVVTLASTGTK